MIIQIKGTKVYKKTRTCTEQRKRSIIYFFI